MLGYSFDDGLGKGCLLFRAKLKLTLSITSNAGPGVISISAYLTISKEYQTTLITVFARSEAAATIYFMASHCAATV